MKKTAYVLGIVLGAVLLRVSGAPLAAQQHKAPNTPASGKPASARGESAKWPAIRNDGQPDVSGVWQPDWGGPGGSGGTAPGTVGMNIEELPNLFGGPRPSASMVIDPPDKKIPYLPWARKRRDEVQDHHLSPNPAQVDTRTRGWPDGVPRLNTYYPVEFHQLPRAVLMLYEVQHEFRYIPLDGRPPLDDGVKLWMGSSRGHWEGTTFVVEVRNLTDQMRLSIAGDFASDGLKVTERWNFVNAKTLEFTATLEDPKVYSRPWTYAQKLKRFEDPNYEAFEYAGVEGTKDPELLGEITGKK